MRNSATRGGFTIVELIVVIAIIGFLAGGAVTTFTSSLQKARDGNRLQSMKAMESALVQIYSDLDEYPTVTAGNTTDGSLGKEIVKYMESIPKDVKSGKPCAKGTNSIGSPCDFYYTVADDSNGISNSYYNLNAGFENLGNIESKASDDNGGMDARYEIGVGKKALLNSTLTDALNKVQSNGESCKVENNWLLIAGGC